MLGETMFIDARRIEEGATIQATVCIIGGGVAGITLAREKDRYGIDTCLLESGGFDPDADTRDRYRGEAVGLPYLYAAGCRGRRFTASPKLFVLATGGSETARLLLASNKAQASGLGNGNDLVGRFFMDHPRLKSGSVRFTRDWSRNKLYDIKYHYMNSAVAAHGTHIASQLALKPEVLQQEGLLNARVWFESLFP